MLSISSHTQQFISIRLFFHCFLRFLPQWSHDVHKLREATIRSPLQTGATSLILHPWDPEWRNMSKNWSQSLKSPSVPRNTRHSQSSWSFTTRCVSHPSWTSKGDGFTDEQKGWNGWMDWLMRWLVEDVDRRMACYHGDNDGIFLGFDVFWVAFCLHQEIHGCDSFGRLIESRKETKQERVNKCTKLAIHRCKWHYIKRNLFFN